MNADDFLARLEAFALREGMTFATMATLPDADRAIVVATMAATFDDGCGYAERDVNERLQSWLDGAGAGVETDRVTLRRWLVDTGVLARDADCSNYRLQARADLPIALARAVPCADVATAARKARADARARRKAAWQERSGAAGGDGLR